MSKKRSSRTEGPMKVKSFKREIQQLRFIDESHRLDTELHLIAALSRAANDDEVINSEVLRRVGLAIQKYLHKRNILEHFFFYRTLELNPGTEVIKAELLRLQKLHREQRNDI